MTKYRIACWFITLAASTCLSLAQSSQVGASSAKPGPDPLQTATKPLTPKSAMPPQRKPSAEVPSAASSRKTSTELARLERQNNSAVTSSSDARSAKGPSVPKSADPSAAQDPPINFKYKKPAGGMQAAKPDANSKNSATPRVKKN
jgi:hypothetical protein